jgi:hypothetical protein
MTDINDIIKRQHFASAYIPQTTPLPGVGMITSLGTAMIALALIGRKLIQAAFNPSFTYESNDTKNGKTVFETTKSNGSTIKMRTVSHMDDALDLGTLFLNNVANVATLGILNYCIVSRDKILPEDFFSTRKVVKDLSL